MVQIFVPSRSGLPIYNFRARIIHLSKKIPSLPINPCLISKYQGYGINRIPIMRISKENSDVNMA